MIAESIQKGIEFLYKEQLGWGEFAMYEIPFNPNQDAVFSSSVFATTFVLYSLLFVEQSPIVKQMQRKGIEFLLDNREEPGVWRYYTKYSSISPDTDDSSCATGVLLEYNVEINPSLEDYFLQLRDPENLLFRTWIDSSPSWENDIDSIVNANILFMYGLMKKSEMIPEVTHYLINEAKNLHTQNSQVWYFSPKIFGYAVSRTYAEGRVKDLQEAIAPICEYLLFAQQDNGSWYNPLETAFATIALLNFGYSGKEIEKAIEYLLSLQNVKKGYWDEELFYVAVAGGGGSKELTTAICLETLAKYKRLYQD